MAMMVHALPAAGNPNWKANMELCLADIRDACEEAALFNLESDLEDYWLPDREVKWPTVRPQICKEAMFGSAQNPKRQAYAVSVTDMIMHMRIYLRCYLEATKMCGDSDAIETILSALRGADFEATFHNLQDLIEGGQ